MRLGNFVYQNLYGFGGDIQIHKDLGYILNHIFHIFLFKTLPDVYMDRWHFITILNLSYYYIIFEDHILMTGEVLFLKKFLVILVCLLAMGVVLVSGCTDVEQTAQQVQQTANDVNNTVSEINNTTSSVQNTANNLQQMTGQ